MNTQFIVDRLTNCYKEAKRSPDTSSWNAAIIVLEEGTVLRPVVNKFPQNVKVTDERLKRPVKYQYTEHAEAGAVHFCAKNGYRTRGAIMFCPWVACSGCARAIVNSGIRRVFCHKERMGLTPSHWLDEVHTGWQIMKEAGVKIKQVSFVAGLECLVDGEKVLL